MPKQPEAGIIREALEGFASGRFPTQADVQRFLRERGFNHWGKGPGAYLEQVKRLLTREVYAGFIHYPPWNVARRKGHHRPLVSPEVFDRIQDRLREREKLPPRKDLHKDFPLRGFVLCAGCRKPLTAAWSRGKKKWFAYYRCNTAGCPHRHKGIRADRMHSEFEALLGRLRPRPSILEAVREELLSQWTWCGEVGTPWRASSVIGRRRFNGLPLPRKPHQPLEFTGPQSAFGVQFDAHIGQGLGPRVNTGECVRRHADNLPDLIYDRKQEVLQLQLNERRSRGAAGHRAS